MSKDPRLDALYPHMDTGKTVAAISADVLAESAISKATESARLKEDWFGENASVLVSAAMAMADIYAKDGRLFTMGNGGSSCDASHFAVEFTHPVSVGRPSLPAFFLGDDIAHLTAVGNDVGFDHVFVRRMLALCQSGDGVVAFSTSGNSENLLRALRTARELEMTTFAMLGGDGGRVASDGLADHCLVVSSESIHRVQEVHVTIYHVLWDLVHTRLSGLRP